MTKKYSEDRLLRIWEILGDPEKGIPALVPVSKSAWWSGIKSGKFPQPVKLGTRTTAWRGRDIKTIIENGVKFS